MIACLNQAAHAICVGRAGNATTAATELDTALALLSTAPWYQAMTARIAAQAALHDHWGDPVTSLTMALDYFATAGHARVADACQALLRRAGVPTRRRGRGAAAVPDELATLGVTSREMDVLHLLGTGMTNRDIAERLCLSQRTVEAHVARLLTKTGSPNRTALARHIPTS